MTQLPGMPDTLAADNTRGCEKYRFIQYYLVYCILVYHNISAFPTQNFLIY